MIAGGKDASLRNMIAFFVVFFCGGTFRTIPDDPKRFKFVTVKLCHVAVIDMNDRVRRDPLFYLLEISRGGEEWSTFFKMAGEAMHNIYFLDSS